MSPSVFMGRQCNARLRVLAQYLSARMSSLDDEKQGLEHGNPSATGAVQIRSPARTMRASR